jgi:diguanylate cyclase (GGDEF)-like protein
MISLHNGWTVTTFADVAGGGVFAYGTALALLLTGILLSLLVGILSLVLATGRTRALRLVEKRTNELRYQSLHDALTGLPNRALILDRIGQLLTRSRRQRTLGAVLFVDLDDFKDVNDTLGHAAGDRLLVAVAARLETTLREADTIGRMGGDEFVVLIDGASLEAAPELVAERLLDVMRQPFDLDQDSLPIIVSASVGIAMGDRAYPEDLLRDADVALYQAKGAGKNRYEVFDPEVRTDISKRTELEFDLRSALEGDQFRLVYQPIYDLDDLTLVGVEALLRWEHPTKGLMQPDRFIPILEQSGQIREVGHWVLREACTQMAAWHAKGDTLDVSVNVSGRQLDDDVIVAHVRDALETSGLPATSLIIEVTETALMRNANATARRLSAIKELGVRVAVDDFGTGYSSLAYLRQFPVDCLKIDRMFTSAITTSPESKALVGTLVQLGRDLGLRTLAEGVETIEEIDDLRNEGVDEAQGFLLARPLDAATIESRFLRPGRLHNEQTGGVASGAVKSTSEPSRSVIR